MLGGEDIAGCVKPHHRPESYRVQRRQLELQDYMDYLVAFQPPQRDARQVGGKRLCAGRDLEGILQDDIRIRGDREVQPFYKRPPQAADAGVQKLLHGCGGVDVG